MIFLRTNGSNFVYKVTFFIVRAELPERLCISVPAVIDNIYRSAVPSQKYLPEQRSAAFRHHYTPATRLQVHLMHKVHDR